MLAMPTLGRLCALCALAAAALAAPPPAQPALRALLSSASPSPAAAAPAALSLPAACNPAFQPFELHATSGTITVGWRDAPPGAPRALQFTPGEAEDDSGLVVPPEGEGGEGGGGGGGAPSLAPPAAASASPTRAASASHTPARGASHSATPSRTPTRTPTRSRRAAPLAPSASPAPPALPAPLTCQWALAGPPGSIVEVTWQWVRAGGSAAEPACSAAGGAYLGLLEGIGATGAEVGSTCFHDAPTSALPPPPLRSNSSQVTLDFILEEGAGGSGGGGGAPVTGFALTYRVYDPRIPNADCIVGAWGPWEACSSVCGGGTRVRRRPILHPASGIGVCTAHLEDEAPCAGVTCPPAPDVPCSLSPWSAWGECVVAGGAGCGAGSRSRTQAILAPASGRAPPCPNRTLLTQTAACSVPCVAPACGGGAPLALAAGAGAGAGAGAPASGAFGLGAPPRRALLPGAPPALATLPPHWPGNTACAWLLDPDAAAAAAAQGAHAAPLGEGLERYVNITLWWLDLPGKPPSACAGNALSLSVVGGGGDGGGEGGGEGGSAPLPLPGSASGAYRCGGSAAGSAPLPVTFTAPFSTAVLVTLASGEAPQTGAFSGFGATYAFGVGRPGYARAPPPPTPAHTTVTLSLPLSDARASASASSSGGFASVPADALAAGIRGDVAGALGVPLYRVVGVRVEVTRRGSGSASSVTGRATLTLIAPAAAAAAADALALPGSAGSAGSSGGSSAASASTVELLAALYRQSRDPASALRRSAFAGYLAEPTAALPPATASGAPPPPGATTLQWATPAAAYIDPPGGLALVYRPGAGAAALAGGSVALENRGGAPLVVTGARLLFPPPLPPPAPQPAQPASALLQLTLPPAAAFPYTLLPGSPSPRLEFGLSLAPGALPAGAPASAFPLFALLQLSHSDPEGPSAVPIEVSWGGGGGEGGSGSGSGIGSGEGGLSSGSIALGVGLTLALGCCGALCLRLATVRNLDGKTACDRLVGMVAGGRAGGAGSGGSGSGGGGAAGARGGAGGSAGPGKALGGNMNFEIVAEEEGEEAGLKGGAGGGGGGGGASIDATPIPGAEAAAGGSFRVTLPGSSSSSSSGGSGPAPAPAASSLFGGLALSGGPTPSRAPSPPHAAPAPAPSSASSAISMPPFSAPAPPGSAAAASAPPHRLALAPRPSLKPATFEALWSSLPTVEVWGASLSEGGEGSSAAIEGALRGVAGVQCMASGTKGGVCKFYYYGLAEGAREGEGAAIIELCLTPPSQRISGILKASSPALGGLLLGAIKEGLGDAMLLKVGGVSI